MVSHTFSTHYYLKTLLRWIYLYDKKQFYTLLFNEKHNHIFLSTLKGFIIENFKINPEYVYWESNDNIKLYGLFYYLMYPCINADNLGLNEDELNEWNFNKRLIPKINNKQLIKIIIDYIKCKETKMIPNELLEIIKNNQEQFYKEYDKIEILNINELNHLYQIKQSSYLSEMKLFEILLKKIKLKLSEEHITINEIDWKNFLNLLNTHELKKILQIMKEIQNDLKYTSELDKEIRFKKYLIDTGKYNKINELIKIYDNKLI